MLRLLILMVCISVAVTQWGYGGSPWYGYGGRPWAQPYGGWGRGYGGYGQGGFGQGGFGRVNPVVGALDGALIGGMLGK